ncbi:MAG: nicotinate (nicotinamide) nucleotide adenylyltransferase [Terracidiphilus sp.]|jgi:nicotinate-nucleotide adenylyltransferase
MTAPPTGRRIAFFGGSFDPPHLGHLAVARAARDTFHLDTVLFAPVGAQPLKPEGSSASFEDRLAMTRLAIEGQPGFEVSLADAPKSSSDRSPQRPPNYTPNYTIDTLERLRADFKFDCALYCLMGADSFFGLRRWHRAAEIPYAAALIVASRPGQPLDGPGQLLSELTSALPLGLTLEPAPDPARKESGANESDIAVRAFLIVNPAGERAPFYVLPGLDVGISASQIRESIREAIRKTGLETSKSAPGSEAVQTMLPVAVAEYIRANGLYR